VSLAWKTRKATAPAGDEGSRFSCPSCKSVLVVPESVEGTKGKCPKCGQKLLIPVTNRTIIADVSRQTAISSATTPDGDTTPTSPTIPDTGYPFISRPNPLGKVGKFLSLPWVALIAIFGFLPWSDMHCNSPQMNFAVTQSGYQALWGGVSSPFNMGDVAQQQFMEKVATKSELAAKAEFLKSDFLMSFSPFLTLFWVVCFAALVAALSLNVGRIRLCTMSGMAVVMLLVLLIHCIIGFPRPSLSTSNHCFVMLCTPRRIEKATGPADGPRKGHRRGLPAPRAGLAKLNRSRSCILTRKTCLFRPGRPM